MGGRIWVDSEVGRGSTFHFTINVGLSGSSRRRAPLPEPEFLYGLTVLVVDDNAANRRILSDTLTAWRMKPVLAESGARALELLREYTEAGERFTLAILDVHMPKMDGFTLASRIQQDYALSGPRIMMLTSLDVRSISPELRATGIADCLVKPVTRATLLTSILKVLGNDKYAPPHAEEAAPLEAVRRLRILLAEDNPVNRKLALRFLERQRHSVTVAVNGAEAVDATARDDFDIVLMDIQMPVMNGYDAARAIRAREQKTGAHVPIVALTAHAMAGDREICLAAGMDDYLSKPIQMRDLYTTLARWSESGIKETSKVL